MAQNTEPRSSMMRTPPRGLMILTLVGPGLVWAGEYIGSGEVILCTRLGAIMGTALLWAPTMAILLKYWIGLSGARYTVCTGEGMIDMFSRMPGPRNWAIWIVLVGQFCAGAVSMGGLSSASAAFLHALLGINQLVAGWAVTLFCVGLVWSGKFEPVKHVTSLLVLIMLVGVFYVALKVFPGVWVLLVGFFGFGLPEIPLWAIESGTAKADVWAEILPVLGWAAGGFASQVWYSYWVLESGYGMAAGGGFGKPADKKLLAGMDTPTAERIKRWCHVVYIDATVALLVGIAVTSCFLVAGAGVLNPAHLAPSGAKVAFELSRLFSTFWGRGGAILFLIAGSAALVSTNLCQFAGWPRIMSDCLRILFPALPSRLSPRAVFRVFVATFLVTNMVIINTLGVQPVMLVKLGAVLDGILLTPLQAVLIAVALFVILPGMLSEKAKKVLRPSYFFLVGLALAAIVFGYFGFTKLFSAF